MPIEELIEKVHQLQDLVLAQAESSGIVITSQYAVLRQELRRHPEVTHDLPRYVEDSRTIEELASVLRHELADQADRRAYIWASFRPLLKELELLLLPTQFRRKPSRPGVMSQRQHAIATALDTHCPAAALCYRQGFGDLREERLSWRGTATEFREALRELLDYLAPDEEVIQAPGFKLEKDRKLPTMAQKVQYVLKKRGVSEGKRHGASDAAEAVDLKVAKFVRSVYVSSSISVHTEAAAADVLSLLPYVDVCLSELLNLEGAG